MAVQFIKFQDLDEKIAGEGIKFVSFYSSTCGPCKMFAPVLEEIAQEYEVYKISTDVKEEIKDANVKSVPLTRVYIDGKITQEVLGYITKEKLMQIIAT